MPADCSAVRTAIRSTASLTTSKCFTQVVHFFGASASSTASSTSSSVVAALGTMTTPLSAEQVRNRPRVSHRAPTASHRSSNVTSSAIPIVRQTLDQDRDTIRSVTLVHDCLPIGATCFGT